MMNKKIESVGIISLIVILGALVSVAGIARQAEDPGVMLRAAIEKEEVDGDLPAAIDLYKQIVAKYGDNRPLAAKALVRLGGCYEKLGDQQVGLAQKAFEKVVTDYADQTEAVNLAKEKLAAFLRARAAAKPGAPEFKLRRIWAGEGVDAEGSVTLDGRYLSFVDLETGDLAVRDLVSGTNRRLTHIDERQPWSEFAMLSKWSRDGRQIAYQWYGQDGVLELRVYDIKAGSIRTIYRDPSSYDWAQAFDWAPDGRRVLAAFFNEATPHKGRETRAGLIAVEDGSVEFIKGHFETLHASFSLPQGFVFSPDGRFVVYDAPRTDEEVGNRDIFLIAMDGRTEISLVEHPANDEVVAWTADGHGLLFRSDRTGSPDLYLLPMFDGKPQESPRLIKGGFGPAGPLGMTSRGDLYYGLGGSEYDIYAVEVDAHTGKVRGPAKKLALPYQGQNHAPAYSPDGKTMAFLSAVTGRGGIIGLFTPETGRVRELRVKLSGNLFPQWIPPEGRTLGILSSDKEGRRIIYKVDIQTGESAPLATLVDGSMNLRNPPVWAKDGKGFFYTAGLKSDEKRYIYKYDLETGKSERLPGSPDDACFIAISPDGNWLAFINEQGKKALRVIPTSGGEPRVVHSYEHGDHVISPAWSADGGSIYLPKLRDPKGNFWDLYRISLDGREVEKTDLGLLWVRFLSVSPDGRAIAFSSLGDKFPQREVWVMENFLPSVSPAAAAAAKGAQEFTMRRVYDGAGLEWGNALSSDGRYLVYTNWDTGDLEVRDLVTKVSRPLTRSGGLSAKSSGEMGETSAFCPDDKKIAYGWLAKDKVPELWVIGSDGSVPRMLFRDEKSGWIRPHDWSPDGRQILAIDTKKDGPSQIIMVSAADGTVRVVRDVAWQDPGLDLSPDGRFIACSMGANPSSSKGDIFIVKTENGDMSPLVAHDADDYSLGWAPDGKTLLFASDRSGSYGLWALDVSDGRAAGSPYLIKSAINKVEPVRLAPNGALYSVQTEEVVDLFTAAVDPLTGKVQGEPKAVPTRYTGANILAVWSPDGTCLAYLTRPGGLTGPNWPAVISILDMRTGEERQVAAKIGSMAPGQGFGWAPDGRSMLIIGRTGEQTAIYKVDLISGAASPLIVIPKFQYTLQAAWSADGKSIFYPQGNPTRILRRDLDTGKDSELATMTGPAGIPMVAPSPDGRWLVFTSQEGGHRPTQIKIVPSAGGEIRELFRLPAKGIVMDLNWTADGRSLWFRSYVPSDDPKKPPKIESWSIPPEGGDLQKLELDVSGGGVRLHPDGRQIVFMKGHGRRDLWVMENFLPKGK